MNILFLFYFKLVITVKGLGRVTLTLLKPCTTESPVHWVAFLFMKFARNYVCYVQKPCALGCLLHEIFCS